MRGHKRFRSGAWRVSVAAGTDPETGRRRSVFETLRVPNNRAGAKRADARLAELIVAVDAGRVPESDSQVGRGPTVVELATMWQEANRPRRDQRGTWTDWSPKTAVTVADNFKYLKGPDTRCLAILGHRPAVARRTWAPGARRAGRLGACRREGTADPCPLVEEILRKRRRTRG